jgi:hypothetical protein
VSQQLELPYVTTAQQASSYNGLHGALPDVYRAINQVSAVMAKYGIEKGDRNAAQGFNFRGIDKVLNALSQPLVDAGLVILPRVYDRVQTERPTKTGGVQFDVALTMAFDLVSVKDGSSHTVIMTGEACDSGDKATSKAASMAYKYMAFQTFCIPVEGLDDADRDTPTPTAAKSKPPSDAPAEPVSDSAQILAEIANAADLESLAAMKVRVSSFRKDPQWPDIKALYTSRNTELKKAA